MAERVLAVLFADVSGSTSLYERLGDRPALDAIESVLAVLRSTTGEFEGRVVKSLGDEIMAVFPSAAAAARAAGCMQGRVAALPAFGNMRVGVRIGMHAGPVLEEGGDVFGDAVNTAARMAELAKSGQIVTTEATVDALPGALRDATRDLDRLAVKGKEGELRVYELLWRDDEDLTLLGTRGALQAVEDRGLRLEHGGRVLLMGAALSTVLLGRDAGNHVVIHHRSASRLHGRIERRRDKYYYTDLSTNGTYVAVAADAEILVRREQIMLRGQGRLAYGHPTTDSRAELVLFSVM